MTRDTNERRRRGMAGLAAGLAVACATSRGQEVGSMTSGSPRSRPNPRLFSFVGGDGGAWSVIKNSAVKGEPLEGVAKLDVIQGEVARPAASTRWTLRGVTSNLRYVIRQEQTSLIAKQVAPGRQSATRAALIPIKKSAAWWDLPHDDRRRIFEETSHHIVVGSAYLPAISRRLHHCRDLSEVEAFDFLTWFDYAPSDSKAFEDLVAALRSTEEWKYVEREVDIRLER